MILDLTELGNDDMAAIEIWVSDKVANALPMALYPCGVLFTRVPLHWIKRNLPKIYFLLGCSNYTIKRHSNNKTIKSFKNTNEAISIDLLWIVWMYETTMTINFKWKAKQIIKAFLL